MRDKLKELYNTNKKQFYIAVSIGTMAVLVLVMACFRISKSDINETLPAESVEETMAVPEPRHYNYSKISSSLKELSSEEEEEYVPAADKLNLAYFYPDDADTSDSINSFAGRMYTDLSSKDADFFASYYDMTDVSPVNMAARNGQGAERVLGKYNPDDPKHDKNNPSSWTVNHFKNISVSFYDGDGNRVNGYYNAQELMSVASVYSFFHNMEDPEAMEEHCRELFDASMSARVSMGNVYYCSGCLHKTIEQEADEAIAIERQNGVISSTPELPVHESKNIEVANYTNEHGSQVVILQNNEQAVINEPVQNSKKIDENVVVSEAKPKETLSEYAVGNEAVKRKESDVTDEGKAELAGTDAISESSVPETTSVETQAPVQETEPAVSDVPAKPAGIDDVIIVGTNTIAEEQLFYNGAVKSDDSVVVSPAKEAAVDQSADASNSGGDAITDTPADISSIASSGTNEHNDTPVVSSDSKVKTEETVVSAASENINNAAESTAAENRTADSADNHESSADGSEKDVLSKSYCPGHIDLYVTVTIKGIDDKKGLFKADKRGNDEANFNDLWQGWTDDKIELARALFAQDWFESYGLSISSIKTNSPLTEEEIKRYIDSLPDTVSEERKAVIEFALNSVGKVPYYWGGKPHGPGYENNSFCKLISPDTKGRILSGLDCSGWINWVYWSATGKPLAGQSTGTLIGCGKRISRADLQPGDIIIRTGEDAHVVMFLCWAQNGDFIAIHETGGVKNNVFVNEMTASWPYYRSLIN